ncbi:PAS domain-containing protein [Shewanella sp. AS1]|uniref:PAS domain-containing protein n=1 Tax=Shewanella sp. AS1 TaxID=2907626 RepID=UPI001F215D9D|nr:PAS domain-containing protein [Shewanella sp. AS1]MCE9678631.1 PAS domain-containing protein [Shewanella sp. AS1]
MVTHDRRHPSISPRTQWKKSLIFKFTIVQFIVATLIITSSIWLLFATEKKHHMDTQLSLSQTYAQSVIEQLQNVVTKIDTLANTISIVGETYKGQVGVIEKLVPPMLVVEDTNNLIAGGGIWPEPSAFFDNQQLGSLFWARDPNGEYRTVEGYNNNDGPGYHEKNWYKPVKYFQNAYTHWSESYVDPYTKELMVTASVPMRVEHEFIGVATVDISLASLDKYFKISDQNPLSKGYILALDAYNNLLSDPFDELSAKQQTDPFLGKPLETLIKQFPSLLPVEKEINRLDEAFYQESVQHPAYQAEQLQTLLNDIPEQHRHRLAALINSALQAKPIKQHLVTLELTSSPLFEEPVLVSILTMEQTQWKILLFTPISSLSQQANAIALKIGAFLLLSQLIALMILFVCQHKLFIRPIFQIVSALQSGNIGRLELDAHKRQDEVGQLAKAFIARSNQLEIAYASLDASNLALEQQLAMQQSAQEELESQRELINSLLNASQNLICIKDTDGKYTLVNDKFCELLGIERTRIVGSHDRDIYPPHVARLIHNNDKLVMASDQALNFEQPMPTVQGERVFLITKYPIKDGDGKLIALGAMAVDVSSLKDKQAEQEQTIQTLTSRLALVQQNLDKLRQDPKLVSEHTVPSNLSTAMELTHQKLLSQLVNQLSRQQLAALENLFILQQKAQNQPPILSEKLAEQIDILRHLRPLLNEQQTKAIILEQYLQDMFVVLSPRLKEKAINWSIDCPKQLTVTLPAWHLFILLYQLINNSIFHGFADALPESEDKLLQIGVEYQQDTLLIKIKDNGLGISQNLLENIRNNLSEMKGYGTLVELHRWLDGQYQGEIAIDSKAGKFTQVECRLTLK